MHQESIKSIEENTHFKLIFWTITGFTIISLILYATFCFMIDSPNDMQNNFARMLQTIIQSGFSALIGLVAGKAV